MLEIDRAYLLDRDFVVVDIVHSTSLNIEVAPAPIAKPPPNRKICLRESLSDIINFQIIESLILQSHQIQDD
jgi:hypothetical protein